MRIQHIQTQQQNKIQNKKTQPKFNGAVDVGLRFLATNQGIGANLTDLSFMVIPRIASDFKRGPAACLETTRREASGTTNHSLIGVYGLLGGMVTATVLGLKNKFNVNLNKTFAAPETINILAEYKYEQLKSKQEQSEYLKNVFKEIKAFNPSIEGNQDGYVKLKEKTVNEITEIMDDAIKNKVWEDWCDASKENSIQTVINKITEETGVQSKYSLEHTGKNLKSNADLKTVLEDLFKVSKSFNEEKVVEAFEAQIRDNKGIADNNYIKTVRKYMKSRALLGFAIAAGIGMTIQPLNIYLTKLKTGIDGFVGVDGRSKDNSYEFKAIKGASAAAFGAMVLTTLQTGLTGFMDKMSFKGFWPTLSQLKGIYGLTIISRILASRDKDELRETLTKDTLGFLSWLVLGDFVNKATAELSDNSVMNRTAEVEKSKNFAKRIFNSTLKTRDEILIKALADNNIKTVKPNGNKYIAKTFKEMLEDLNKISDKEKVAKVKKQLKVLNRAQAAGYLFSGLILGIGIPNFNYYVTKKIDEQRKEKANLQNK